MKIKQYKISRRLLFILCAGIFVIAFAALLFLYLDEVQEKKDLDSELATVENQIVIIELDIASSQQEQDDLEAEIAQTKAEIAGIKTQLSTSLLTSEIFQNMLAVASDTHVSLTFISESSITNGDIAGVSYQLRTINFTVDGSALNVYNFVDKLSQDLDTSILNSMGMSTTSNPNAYTSASMRLTIYSY